MHTLPNKGVSSPSAPIGTMSLAEKELESELKVLRFQLGEMEKQYRVESILCVFLLETGCRITEALQIQSKDIDSLGRVKIKGLKGSESRIVYSTEAKAYMLGCKKNNIPVFSDFNRFHIYRVCKRYGIGKAYNENKVMSVTHYFRHISSLISRQVCEGNFEIQRMLGHKNEKSTNYYV
ncbi:MAG: tyrosine-type recombinase/integrase [Saprospiraceae bacterium]|nr:tyrosine-type recombinase/integrase [Saprospiraceae bacterium]